jgi:hypothetical protein
MKKRDLTLVGVLSLLLAAGSAFAQAIYMKADVPFNFIVGKETLPAGQYTIESFGTVSGMTLLIRSEDNKPKALVNTNSAQAREAPQQSKLVFTRYGDRCFLSEIWVRDSELGHRLPKSAREAEVAMNGNPQQVVVLARLH